MSIGRVLLRDLRSSHDLVAAGVLSLAALLLTTACALTADPPVVAWTVFAWVGICGLLLLVTAVRAAQGARAVSGLAEVRGVILVALLLAQVGFLLRLSGPGTPAPAREGAVFLTGALAFVTAREAGRRVALIRVWIVAVVVLFLAALAAVILTPHPTGPRLQWEHTLPASVLAVTGAGALACWWATQSGRVPPTVVWPYFVAVPPLAVFAFTRDAGAALLTGGAFAAAVIGAGRLLWRSAWPVLLGLVALGLAAAVAIGVAMRVLNPAGIFVVPPGTPARDLMGAWRVRGAPMFAAVGGQFGRIMVLVLVALFAVQVALLIARVMRPVASDDGRSGAAGGSFVRVWAVAAGGQVLVAIAGPFLADALALPAPASLTTLPVASDGASFVMTFATLGLLLAAGERTAPPRPARGGEHLTAGRVRG